MREWEYTSQNKQTWRMKFESDCDLTKWINFKFCLLAAPAFFTSLKDRGEHAIRKLR